MGNINLMNSFNLLFLKEIQIMPHLSFATAEYYASKECRNVNKVEAGNI